MAPLTSGAARLALAAALLALSGCMATQPTAFYTLSSLPREADVAALRAPSGPTVGVAPISLPDYLNRPQIVTRTGQNQMSITDFNSWVEPMDSMMPRVLAENLSVLLGTDNVLLLPQRRPASLDYRVDIEVARFEADGEAVLDAQWWVYGQDGERLLDNGFARIRQPIMQTDGYASVAAAMSGALAILSRQIAAAIQASRG